MWAVSEEYFNNGILGYRDYDPRKLLNYRLERWGIDNLIPEAVRTYGAWVLSRPFELKITPMGESGDQVRYLAASGVQKFMEYYKAKPEFKEDIRMIAIRMKLFNMVGQLDYWDSMRQKPCSRIIDHHDIFVDPTAKNGVNLIGGPRWVAIRVLLNKDEAINRYGAAKVDDMTPGLLIDEDEATRPQNERKAPWDHLYEVLEWYGMDETEVRIEEAETQAVALEEINAALDGTFQGPDPDIDHQQAIDYGDSLMITYATEYGAELPEDLEGEMVALEDGTEIPALLHYAIYALADMGMGAVVEGYMMWRSTHKEFLDDGDAGGTEPKYPGYIYKTEFQYSKAGEKDPLAEPETLDYPHYQIPVSLFRSHLNTRPGLFGHGPMSEVLSLQNDIEYWERTQQDFAHYQARPPFFMDIDYLHPDQRKAMGGLKKIVERIREGMYVFFTKGKTVSKGRAVEPHFAKIGQFSIDVLRLLEYKRYRLQEIIGPTPVLRGDVGNEASGKQVAIRTQSAAVPINDTLTLIESPMQKTMERMVANLLAYGDIVKLAQIAGQERAQAIQAIRDENSPYYIPDFRCMVAVNMGNTFPTDTQFLINFGMTAVQAGILDPKEFEEKVGSPFKLQQPPPQGAPGAPGPGQGSPPAPQQIKGIMQ